eukprot:scaffold101055_cov70-Phaeocystis_antarctica.AAC.1
MPSDVTAARRRRTWPHMSGAATCFRGTGTKTVVGCRVSPSWLRPTSAELLCPVRRGGTTGRRAAHARRV